MEVQYTGENLFTGMAGRMMIWASLLTVLVAAVFYIVALRRQGKPRLLKLADNFYYAHLLAFAGAFAALYYLIATHAYEYSYVWQYSSNDMPLKYMLSCFWAGQEGSYMIWALLQGITGLVLLRTARDWKPWVMPVFITGQLFLLSMILGLKIGDFAIGGSPFNLLRDLVQNNGEAFFKDPNYLKMITDGNGLNPLLENIWMIIHPPALFLGYAVSLVPFSYVVASLWRKDFRGWLRPGLAWTLASLLTLGIGIILGGRWAYESLTFGGFWAWDPVENASLVPWLLLIASLHMLLINYKRDRGYITSYLFLILTWFFIVYATYLTRSGVLGETSVHSFGVNELSAQMIAFCMFYLLFPLALLFMRSKLFTKNETDEFLSREFWMLIGSVIAALSAFQIITTTSIPVFNKILGKNFAPPTDNIDFYNTWQLPFAVGIALSIVIGQYLHYGKNSGKDFLKRLLISTGISAVITLLITIGGGFTQLNLIVLLFSVVLTIVVSVDFIIQYLRKSGNIGASLTHAGFSIFMLGVLLAFSNSEIISQNTSGISLGKQSDNDENLVLTRGVKQPMGDYLVTYSDAETKGAETFYRIDFVKLRDTATGKIAFSVRPSVNRNTRMGAVYNPDTKHFADKDIYTYISYAEQTPGSADTSGFVKKEELELNENDTAIVARSYLILDAITSHLENNDVNNAGIIAKFKVLSMKAGTLATEIKYEISNGSLERTDGLLEPLGVKLRFEGISPDSQAIRVGVYEKQQDYIVIKTIIFPFMPVLWFGVILMFAGITYAMARRMQKPAKKDETVASE